MSDLTLAEFLAARLGEDEAAAKLVESTWPGETIANVLADPEHYAWKPHDVSPTRAAHIARHDPARVLREAEAGRKILALHQEDEDWPHVCLVCLSDRSNYPEMWRPDDWPCPTLRTLAAVYSDHPDYDEEWRP